MELHDLQKKVKFVVINLESDLCSVLGSCRQVSELLKSTYDIDFSHDPK
jgi:hypothetical protein